MNIAHENTGNPARLLKERNIVGKEDSILSLVLGVDRQMLDTEVIHIQGSRALVIHPIHPVTKTGEITLKHFSHNQMTILGLLILTVTTIDQQIMGLALMTSHDSTEVTMLSHDLVHFPLTEEIIKDTRKEDLAVLAKVGQLTIQDTLLCQVNIVLL